MLLNGAHAQNEFCRDLGVALATGDQAQNLRFALG
jgi:hypothetical protein